MKRNVNQNRMIRVLAASLWLAGIAVYPLQGEAALPTHPQSDSTIVGNAPIGSRHETVKIRVVRPQTGRGRQAGDTGERISRGQTSMKPAPGRKVQPGRSAGTTIRPSNAMGYTEAELRERMIRQHTQIRPDFRLVSGAFVGSGYRPGTMDVKIPKLFFPPDTMQDVSETFLENPDGTFGTRAPEDQLNGLSSYGAEAQQQLQSQGSGNAGEGSYPVHSGTASARAKYKTITVQVPVPAPSPFRPLAAGDFRWFTNSRGHYVVALPASMPYDPLQKLPAFGPMLLRNTSQKEFMAVTADDPADTYYYKNQDTFPGYGKAVPVFTETRKNIQGDDVKIQYIRRYIGGEHCLIVDSAGQRAGKTYRTAIVFPESKQYEYLPKALYMIETLKGM